MSCTIYAADTIDSLSGIETRAVRVAENLRERGLRYDERVLLKADNSTGFVVMLLALMHLGQSIVLADHRRTEDETQNMAQRGRVRWAITDDKRTQVVPEERLLSVDALSQLGWSSRPTSTRLSWSSWQLRQDALILWSSGSTAAPKGVVRSGKSMLNNLRSTSAALGYSSHDVFMPLLPFTHQYGLSVVLLACLNQSSLIVAPYSRMDLATKIGGQSGVTIVDAPPSTYRSLLNIFSRRPYLLSNFSSVRMCCTGGAPIYGSLGGDWLYHTTLPLLDGYGSTEAGNVAFATLDNPIACGQPISGVEIAVCGDNGDRRSPGSVGEIWLRANDLMEGYLADDGSTEPLPADTWYNTEDLGYLDSAGNLSVIGRKSAVHRHGFTLYPDAIARKAEQCGRRVHFVPMPDTRCGSLLIAFVEDPEGGGAEHWQAVLHSYLAQFERPNRVFVIEQLPVNETGKVATDQLARTAKISLGRPPTAADSTADRIQPVRGAV